MVRDEFDEFVNKLQKEIIENELKEFNETIIDLYHSPRNWGKPPDEEITKSHAYEGPCGDTMQFFLKIKNNKIEKANFITDGCGATVACGSQTTMLIEGRSIDFAENLKEKDIDMALNGLPEDHKHCAELAIRTLRRLIEKYKYRTF
ncbi:MAG: iron-sulfur cluster assembly scaffold protein [Candidatus Hodarchaeota archaeon]